MCHVVQGCTTGCTEYHGCTVYHGVYGYLRGVTRWYVAHTGYLRVLHGSMWHKEVSQELRRRENVAHRTVPGAKKEEECGT